MAEIYGTLGPACRDQAILEQMFREGLTGMRLNLSHTGLMDSAEILKNYLRAAQCAGVEPQLLIDMQGPELRVGALEKAIILKEGELVQFVNQENVVQQEEKDSDYITIPVPVQVLNALVTGDIVLVNDGKIALQTINVLRAADEMTEKLHEDKKSSVAGNAGAELQIIRGGILTGHKSIKIVGKDVDMPVLTAHDISNIRLAAAFGVTALMQPFVRSGEDLRKVRKELRTQHAEDIQIWGKIENRKAVDAIADILPEADVIVIARGDLGNDMELWELPGVQKTIEQACKAAGKPYIVVTQMLASMETSPVPTRAEVSDIFHAVAEGAYGVMITGESAAGNYPVEAVRYLAKTAESAERWKLQTLSSKKTNNLTSGSVYK